MSHHCPNCGRELDTGFRCLNCNQEHAVLKTDPIEISFTPVNQDILFVLKDILAKLEEIEKDIKYMASAI